MTLSAESIESARDLAVTAINEADSLDGLKDAKLAHMGDRSPIAKANQLLGTLAAEERAQFGKIIGQAMGVVAAAYEAQLAVLEAIRDARVLVDERVDVSIPARRGLQGGLHPLTILTNEICDLFLGMGYRVAEGPELEAEWLNFDALNIPADHPARTMQDTFFIEPLESHLVLRTHTSPVQVRTMLTEKPPIYVICPGRTYRADELDATHTPVFSQVEGLVVDKGITMADLKGTLDHFAQSIFGADVKTRLRSSFFPFTEPSAEVDFYFHGRWIEWGGCGMVNPKVLVACGIDPDEYTGFAFGMGLERTLMVRHGISDMHDIVEGDIRFSQMFGTGIK
jgi:phenylalanyl-tRNA synthetase alpha chain